MKLKVSIEGNQQEVESVLRKLGTADNPLDLHGLAGAVAGEIATSLGRGFDNSPGLQERRSRNAIARWKGLAKEYEYDLEKTRRELWEAQHPSSDLTEDEKELWKLEKMRREVWDDLHSSSLSKSSGSEKSLSDSTS